MHITSELQAELKEIMTDYWATYSNGDLASWASYLPATYHNIGTNEDEVWTSKQQIVDFTNKVADQYTGKIEIRDRTWQFIPLDPYVMVHEFGNLFIKAGEDCNFYSKMRLSSLLSKTHTGWQILHQQGSYPDTRLEKGEFFGFQNLRKENTELRDAVKRRTTELELKNRELQIEAALDRVRARTMAMQHSNDLIDAATILFEQVRSLGAATWNCSFNIWSADKSHAVAWNTTKEGFGRPFNKPSNEDVFKCFYNGANNPDGLYIEEIGGQNLVKHYEYLTTIPGVGQTLAELKAAGVELPTFQIFNIAYFAHGYLMFITYEPVPEYWDIFKRFAKGFEQTYTRFLDLKKAEEQTRAAQVELALERVRARTMAMHDSDELADASFALDTQVRAFGIPIGGCAFNSYNETDSTDWFCSEAGVMPTYKPPREKLFLRYYEAGQRGERLRVEEYAGAACAAHYAYLCTVPGMGDRLRAMIEAGGSFPECQLDHVVYF